MVSVQAEQGTGLAGDVVQVIGKTDIDKFASRAAQLIVRGADARPDSVYDGLTKESSGSRARILRSVRHLSGGARHQRPGLGQRKVEGGVRRELNLDVPRGSGWTCSSRTGKGLRPPARGGGHRLRGWQHRAAPRSWERGWTPPASSSASWRSRPPSTKSSKSRTRSSPRRRGSGSTRCSSKSAPPRSSPTLRGPEGRRRRRPGEAGHDRGTCVTWAIGDSTLGELQALGLNDDDVGLLRSIPVQMGMGVPLA